MRVLFVAVIAAAALSTGAVAGAERPVTPAEAAAVRTDWFAHHRFAERHSCAAVVVARADAPPAYKEGTPFVHALDLDERAVCTTSASAAAVRVGMSNRAVAETAGAPVPWRSGPYCWWYRKPDDGRRICFDARGYVDRIQIAVHG